MEVLWTNICIGKSKWLDIAGMNLFVWCAYKYWICSDVVYLPKQKSEQNVENDAAFLKILT